MNIFRKWVLNKMTVNELVEYFAEIGIGIDLTFQKKPRVIRYAKNSRIYKVTK